MYRYTSLICCAVYVVAIVPRSGVDSPPKDKDQNPGVSSIGGYVEAGGTTGVSRGRSTVATKRLRLLMLHGNSAAASLLLQVAWHVALHESLDLYEKLSANSCGGRQ